MRRFLTTAIAALTFSVGSAASAQMTDQTASYRPQPRPVATFSVAAKRIEMLAVTRRARADTPLRRDHMEDSINMSKVVPGYPQPAFVSVDFRIKF